MQENFLIQIQGKIVTDDDTDIVDLTTTGDFYQKNGKYYICYKESGATGFEGSMTTVKVWDKGASIARYGTHRSYLLIEEGTTNICNYNTSVGGVILDINGISVSSDLNEHGGDISLAYSLNGSGMLISENTINLKIKEM